MDSGSLVGGVAWTGSLVGGVSWTLTAWLVG